MCLCKYANVVVTHLRCLLLRIRTLVRHMFRPKSLDRTPSAVNSTVETEFARWLLSLAPSADTSKERYADGPLHCFYANDDDSRRIKNLPGTQIWVQYLMDMCHRHGTTPTHAQRIRGAQELPVSRVPICTILTFMRCYVETIEINYPGLLEWSTMHRLVLTAWLLATKFVDDQPISYKFVARECGLQLSEILHMESCFLDHGLHWKLGVQPVRFADTMEELATSSDTALSTPSSDQDTEQRTNRPTTQDILVRQKTNRISKRRRQSKEAAPVPRRRLVANR